MTNQPKWKLVAQLGDVHPIDYGGYFIYIDETGVYAPEAVKLISPDSDDGTWEIRRFLLDDLKIVSFDGRNLLIPAKYDETWSHPVQNYDEWFNDDLQSVASFIGTDVEALRLMFVSDDITAKARAWEAIGEYHGFDNLDSYPLFYSTRSEVEARYAGEKK